MNRAQQLLSAIRNDDPGSIELLRGYIRDDVTDLMELKSLEAVVQPGKHSSCWIVLQSHLIDHDSNTQDLEHISQIILGIISPQFDICDAYLVGPEFGMLLSKITALAADLPAMALLKLLYQLCLKLDSGKVSPIHACFLRLSSNSLHFYAKKLIKSQKFWSVDDRLGTTVSDIGEFFLHAASILTDQQQYSDAYMYFLIAIKTLMPLRDYNIQRPGIGGPLADFPENYLYLVARLIPVALLEDRSIKALKKIDPEGPANASYSISRPQDHQIANSLGDIVTAAGTRDTVQLKKLLSSKNVEATGSYHTIRWLRLRLVADTVMSHSSAYASRELASAFNTLDNVWEQGQDSDAIDLLKSLDGTEISDSAGMIYFSVDPVVDVTSLRRYIDLSVEMIQELSLIAKDDKITQEFLKDIIARAPRYKPPSARSSLSGPSTGEGVPLEALVTARREMRQRGRRTRRRPGTSSPAKPPKLRAFASTSGDKWSPDVSNDVSEDQTMESDGGYETESE